MPDVLRTVSGVRDRLDAERRDDGRQRRVALVPTMGALHDGHLALVRRAQESAEVVVVSVFVNPLQFGAGEDLDRYPRDLDADVERLASVGVDVVFAPDLDEVYPGGPVSTRVTAGPVGSTLEGAARPGHFDGVLTVVAKLLGMTRPHVVVFGEKDAQQLHLVRRMVADLDIAVEVSAVPIVREADGLALSSRNRYLSAEARRSALALSAALDAVGSAGEQGTDAALAAGRAVLAADPRVDPGYLVAVDPRTFAPVAAGQRGEALVLVAAAVDGTRLIDNRTVTFD